MMHKIPRWLAGLAGSVLLASLLAACGGDEPTATSQPTATPLPGTATPTPKAAWEIEWDTVLEAAQEEGEVVMFAAGSLGRSKLREHLQQFEEKFGIKVIFSTGSSRQNADKILAERVAEKYTLDVWMGGSGTASTRLIPGNVLRPIPPLLFHPEVLDLSAWTLNRLMFLDAETQQFILVFAASGVKSAIAYNTELVDPAEFVSYWDLLDPKWKGQIVMRDPRITGQSLISFYVRPSLGPEFVERLLTEMDIVIADDARSAIEGLAVGKWAICLLACAAEAVGAKGQGLPVEPTLPNYMTEGGRLSSGAGSFYLVDTPKNPNAQKFFANWWLTREGQIFLQEASGNDSLRTDIPKDSVDPTQRREEGATYVWPQTRPSYATDLLEVQQHSKDALASVGR